MAIFAIAPISRAWSGKTVKGWSNAAKSVQVAERMGVS
jgi:hypothetical protein